MENSSAEDQQRRGEETYGLFTSPCHLFQKLVNVFFKCFGYDHDHIHESSPTIASQDAGAGAEAEAEAGMKTTKEVDCVILSTILFSRRRPIKPPVSSGGGGQIN